MKPGTATRLSNHRAPPICHLTVRFSASDHVPGAAAGRYNHWMYACFVIRTPAWREELEDHLVNATSQPPPQADDIKQPARPKLADVLGPGADHRRIGRRSERYRDLFTGWRPVRLQYFLDAAVHLSADVRHPNDQCAGRAFHGSRACRKYAPALNALADFLANLSPEFPVRPSMHSSATDWSSRHSSRDCVAPLATQIRLYCG